MNNSDVGIAFTNRTGQKKEVNSHQRQSEMERISLQRQSVFDKFLTLVGDKNHPSQTQTKKQLLDKEELEKESPLADLPSFYVLFVGVISYFVLVVVFAIQVNIGYQESRNSPDLQLVGPGNVEGCTVVKNIVNGKYIADTQGRWVGEGHSTSFLGIYDINFNFFYGSEHQFNISMIAAYDDLNKKGEFCKNYNLAYNLIYWISYVFEYDNSVDNNDESVGFDSYQNNLGGILVSLTGTAKDVFNLPNSHAQISGVHNHCNVTGYGEYDYANALYTASYQYDKYINAGCDELLNPQALNYNPKINDNILKIELDVNSLSTAIAVNMGVLEMETLGIITSVAPLELLYNNAIYYFVQVFDDRFASMDPILCAVNGTNIEDYLNKYKHAASFSGYSNVNFNKNSYKNLNGTLNENEICFSYSGGVVALPVLNHIGASGYSPLYCDCETGVGKTEPCQQFNLLASLIYYNQPITQNLLNSTQQKDFMLEQIKDLLSLIFGHENSHSDHNITSSEAYEKVQKGVFNASFAAATAVYDDVDPIMRTSTWRLDAYNFCKLGAVLYCNIITFNMFSSDAYSVSANKFQLTNGSCHNSFIYDKSFFDELLVDPPMQFTQIFQECVMGKFAAFYNAVGIAQGNVSIQAPVFVIAVLPLFYLLLLCFDQIPPKEEYDDQEKQDAIEILSLQLLRLRDGKTRGIKKKGILTRLAAELISAAKQSGGYPDSDDEIDDDDDDDDDRNSISNPLQNGGLKSDKSNRRSKKYHKNDESIVTKKHSKGHKMGVFTKHLEEDTDRESFWGVLDIKNNKRASDKKIKIALNLGIRKKEKQNYSNLYVLNSLETNADAAEDSQILNELLASENIVMPYRNAKTKSTNYALVFEKIVNLLSIMFAKVLQLPESTRMTSIEFTRARILSTAYIQLNLVDIIKFDEFDNIDNNNVALIHLSNIICMHGSISLNCSMMDIGKKHAAIVSYEIGDIIVTPAHITSFLHSN